MGMKLLQPALHRQRGAQPTWLRSNPGPQRPKPSSGGFKAPPAPSTSSGHHGPPGLGAAQQSPEPQVEAERELTALSRVLFCSPRRAPAGLCQLTGSLNIARESGFASGAVNRVTRNEKEYL